ncbi:MAG: hypothetical protein HY619_07285 [Thaumarchaeota archaeon]|nr:hypothetical protein [Nitrososphaerota archaeon]
MVAIDGPKILGAAAVLRITPKNVAIGCFNVSRVTQMNEVSDLLVSAAIVRAQKTGHSFISCIPGQDKQPSISTLQKHGFLENEARATFSGKVHPSSGHRVREITDREESLRIIKSLFPSIRTVTLFFRPAPLGPETMDQVLSRGAFFISEETKASGAALAFEGKCLQQEMVPLYMVPEYLAGKIPLQGIEKAGEITVLALDASSDVLNAATNWLFDRGVPHANIYASQDKETGVKLMEHGFDPSGTHMVWTKALTGPMDPFLSLYLN